MLKTTMVFRVLHIVALGVAVVGLAVVCWRGSTPTLQNVLRQQETSPALPVCCWGPDWVSSCFGGRYGQPR